MSLRLSKQHGVNPSVRVCFWCGKGMDVILFGASYKQGKEAPREIITGYDPCDQCQKDWKLGILLVEVVEHPINELPPITKTPDLYPTGRHCVVTREAAARWFSSPMREEVLEKGRAWIGKDAVAMIGLDKVAEKRLEEPH